jgi:hypothetical protein
MPITQNGRLPRDDNDVPVAGAVEDNAGAAIKPWKVDPTTGRLLVSATIAGLGTQVLNEVVGGSGTAWTLAHTPNATGVALYANGQRLMLTVDYSIVGAAITTVLSWSAGTLIADYQY